MDEVLDYCDWLSRFNDYKADRIFRGEVEGCSPEDGLRYAYVASAARMIANYIRTGVDLRPKPLWPEVVEK
jgi:hypothetical protein